MSDKGHERCCVPAVLAREASQDQAGLELLVPLRHRNRPDRHLRRARLLLMGPALPEL